MSERIILELKLWIHKRKLEMVIVIDVELFDGHVFILDISGGEKDDNSVRNTQLHETSSELRSLFLIFILDTNGF